MLNCWVLNREKHEKMQVLSAEFEMHYLFHRMIHFDIPWSLMVFKQRNGRIDRYGQSETPRINYLLTDSLNPDIKGDTRILQLLIEKDEQAAKKHWRSCFVHEAVRC